MIKVFVVDDHKIVRDGIKAMLAGNTGYKFVGESAGGYKAIELLEKIQVDVLILDINLPDGSGLDIIPEILSRNPGIKIIMLTANIDEESVTLSVKAGAQGFLHKDISEEELLLAIDTVFRTNEPFFGEKISHIIYKSFVSKTRNPQEKENKAHSLTLREQEVLKLLADGHNC
ncbi:MAG: response regulator transcription factor, partial [Bacteroidales bacterium]|nr:response regulator transcription factor [Bacteroidales bacterium]